MSQLDAAAETYLSAGLSVLPARRVEKRPAVGTWKQYQERLPSKAELSAWLANGHDAVCILCGTASGHLEAMDFDAGGERFNAWWERIPPELRARLVVERTPSGGYHVVYRCEKPICGNLKLAQRRVDGKVVALIETRGEGGLFLCAPTPGYELVQGSFAELPLLTEAERDVLLQTAWELNEYVPEPIGATASVTAAGGRVLASVAGGPTDRPGDAFNAGGDVRAVLEKHGWQRVRGGENEYWRRPDKDSGWSATLKNGVLYVFSSNAAPFEPATAYSAFGVYAMLEHGGDFGAAAGALRREGYGADASIGVDSGVDDARILTAAQAVETRDATAAEANEQQASRRLTLIRADQIEMRPPDWLLRGMLERDTFAMVFGDPGSGKSFLAIDWACRVATGTPWRGHPVKPGPVVYIAGEGQQGFGRRIRAWQEHHGVSLAGAPLFVARAVAIPEPSQLGELIVAIEQDVGRPALIVLDTLARTFGGGDENSTQDMSRFVSACDTIRQRYESTILVAHHTGHGDKNRARGAIALKAALDAEYRLSDNEAGLKLTATKMKDAETPAPLTMDLVSVDLPGLLDDYGNPVTSAAVEVLDAECGALESEARTAARGKWQRLGLEVAERLIDAADGGCASVRQWHLECDAEGMRKSTRYDVLTKLHEQGAVIVEGDALIPTRAPHPSNSKVQFQCP